MANLPATPTFNETGVGVVCDESILAGYPWDCPSWGVMSSASPYCGDRTDTIEALTEYYNILKKIGEDILSDYGCPSLTYAAQCAVGDSFLALSEQVLEEAEELRQATCFL
jgi:hypothetical protein